MESPLEVLSRAATMVQDNANETKISSKELPTTKWRRDRRLRISEYHSQSPIPYSSCLRISNDEVNGEAPLDMTLSTKPRTPPPPYREPLPGSTYASSSSRPSVITQAPKREKINNKVLGKESISMCDPVIDEHFRRSLGDDYMILFSKNKIQNDKENSNEEDDKMDEKDEAIIDKKDIKIKIEKDIKEEAEEENITECIKSSPVSTPGSLSGSLSPGLPKLTTSHQSTLNTTTTSNDSIELSVDDHFAKALGDTWKRLQEGNGKITNTNNLSNNNSKKDSIRPCVVNEVV